MPSLSPKTRATPAAATTTIINANYRCPCSDLDPVSPVCIVLSSLRLFLLFYVTNATTPRTPNILVLWCIRKEPFALLLFSVFLSILRSHVWSCSLPASNMPSSASCDPRKYAPFHHHATAVSGLRISQVGCHMESPANQQHTHSPQHPSITPLANPTKE